MTSEIKYNKVNFLPWIGKKYEEGFNGQKLLVLGESHYCPERKKCKECNVEHCLKQGYTKEDYCNQTLEVIEGYLHEYNGERYLQTFLCFERAIFGKVTSAEEKDYFWNHVAFYNYFQSDFYKEPGKRTMPEFQDFKDSEEAFLEILNYLKPEKIIVWGKRLYNYLPSWNGTSSEIIIEGESAQVWTYCINKKVIQCMEVSHPSTPSGKCWEYWHPFYDIFLQNNSSVSV